MTKLRGSPFIVYEIFLLAVHPVGDDKVVLTVLFFLINIGRSLRTASFTLMVIELLMSNIKSISATNDVTTVDDGLHLDSDENTIYPYGVATVSGGFGLFFNTRILIPVFPGAFAGNATYVLGSASPYTVN